MLSHFIICIFVAYILHFIHTHHCMRSSLVNKEPKHDAGVSEGGSELLHFYEFCTGSIMQTQEQQGKKLSILHVCSIKWSLKFMNYAYVCLHMSSRAQVQVGRSYVKCITSTLNYWSSFPCCLEYIVGV